MTNALNENDIQKVFNYVETKYKNTPLENMMMFSKEVDNNGKDLFVFNMSDIGKLTLSPDVNGEYQIIAIDDSDVIDHKLILTTGLKSIIRQACDKEWSSE